MASNIDKPEESQPPTEVIEDQDPQVWAELAEEINQGTQSWRGASYDQNQTFRYVPGYQHAQYVPVRNQKGVQYYPVPYDTRSQMGQYLNYYPTPEQPIMIQRNQDQQEQPLAIDPPKFEASSRPHKKKKEYVKRLEERKYFKEANCCPHGLTYHYTHKLGEEYSIQTLQYTFDMIIGNQVSMIKHLTNLQRTQANMMASIKSLEQKQERVHRDLEKQLNKLTQGMWNLGISSNNLSRGSNNRQRGRSTDRGIDDLRSRANREIPPVPKSICNTSPCTFVWDWHVQRLHLVPQCITNLFDNTSYSTSPHSVAEAHCCVSNTSCQKKKTPKVSGRRCETVSARLCCAGKQLPDKQLQLSRDGNLKSKCMTSTSPQLSTPEATDDLEHSEDDLTELQIEENELSIPAIPPTPRTEKLNRPDKGADKIIIFIKQNMIKKYN
ncbi:hypothetical protein J6590_093672 [Homalodisca vitripennis]|nr:hypothetical protein J6590_093672 [Homalodisca vitripennis]